MKYRVGIRFSICFLHHYDVHPASRFVGEKNDDKNYSFYNWFFTARCAVYLTSISTPSFDNDTNLVVGFTCVVFNGPIWTSFTWALGAFMSIGAYVTTLLWNYSGVSPWIGIPAAMIT